MLGGFFLLRKQLLAVAANGADVVLRPLIGSTNTLKLESFVFGIEDKMNTIHGKAPTSADAVFNGSASSLANQSASPVNSGMSLAPIAPLTQLAPFSGEGEWKNVAVAQFPKDEVMARTLLHVDQDRPFAYAALVKMDGSKLRIGSVAGTKQPGGPIGNPGPGKVPDSIQNANELIAAFDGGFQYRDGAYGMITEGKTYVPLRSNLATLIINSLGKASIIDYQGQKINSDVVTVRQNGPLLVRDGQITPFTEEGKDTWGRTVTNSMYTWRSGLGVTKTGDLIYAVGPSLVPQTLALALKSAGAVNAMQLDINPFWVRYAIFYPTTTGTYQSLPLLKNMENGGPSYLHGYQKDFFYVFTES
jgi:hypothetical protein